MTGEGFALLGRIGIELPNTRARELTASRPLCRPCLDWSERRPHVAGKLGAAICTHGFEKGWIRRRKDTRAVEITPRGRLALRDVLGIY